MARMMDALVKPDRAPGLILTQVPVPTPGPGEVLIRNMAAGICGTDVHIYHGSKGSADVIPPVVLGHEYSGVVETVGEGVVTV